MPRFKLVVEYAGTKYSGWQIQKNARTVAGEIERAVADVTRRREFELYGAGRTDAGVHALAQVAHLDIYTDMAPQALRAFVGMRDFASFSADEPGEKSTRVLVDRLEIGEAGDLILVRIIGSHFLWRMVRRLVGVLAAVGRGDLTAAQAAGFMEEASELPATLTAPSSGLFLEAVYYAGDPEPGPLQPVVSVPSR